MVYVFTFLGEFGYELLNWQGVIRTFAATIRPSDRIVCCSRANVYPLYEMADLYLDITDHRLFRHSRGCCYSGTIGAGAPGRGVNRMFDAALRTSLQRSLARRVRADRPEWADHDLCFVFSSVRTDIAGVTFGCDPARVEQDADIDDRLNLDANLYRRIEPDMRLRAGIEQALGIDLSEPYVLVQTRERRVGPQLGAVAKDALIRALAARSRVVLLSFHTGRAFDSFSRFEQSSSCLHYGARSFPEQACLVHFAARCIFLTEGEFGSHTYVPPFMGKDVTLIAPRSLHDRWRATVDFWNRHVCRFGGQIEMLVAEDVAALPEPLLSAARRSA